MDSRTHWNKIYGERADEDLSWFQHAPAASMSLIARLDRKPASAVDIGAGQSLLAGELLGRGVERITALDISSAGLDRAAARLGPRAERIDWVAGDVLRLEYPLDVDLWHDRAVFHFLTDEQDRRRYADAARAAVRAGGWMIVATFGPAGPAQCSGLPVQRYSAEELAAQFSPGFTLIDSVEEQHTTPWGKPQQFVYAVLRRDA